MEECNFNIGDEVILVESFLMAAEVGARAIICDVNGEYIVVSWVRDGKSKNQMNGSYSPKNFMLASPLLEALL